MSELTSLTLSDARDLLRKREFSAVELTKAHVAAIREARALNAFVLETPERAYENAARAVATDRGGWTRQPAALTGIVGIKPTYGRCARFGIVAYASSLDQAGPFARTVRDAAILLAAMAGHDAKDTTSANIAVPDYEAALTRSVRGMKIGRAHV